MEYETLALIFGSILLIIGIYGSVISWKYYVFLKPPTNKFALRVMLAFIFFGVLGGFAVIGFVFFEGMWWPFIALFTTLGFLILAYSSLHYLRLLILNQKLTKEGIKIISQSEALLLGMGT